MPIGTGYGLVPQGQVGTGTAQVFNNTIAQTFAYTLDRIQSDFQQAQQQKKLDKEASTKASTWKSKAWESDLNNWLGPLRRETENFYVSEKVAGRDPDDVTTESGRQYNYRKQTTIELGRQSEQWKALDSRAMSSFNPELHDEKKTQDLWVKFRNGNPNEKRKLLEKHPDLLIDREISLWDAVDEFAGRMGIRVQAGKPQYDLETGIMTIGATQDVDPKKIMMAANELFLQEGVVEQVKSDYGLKTNEEVLAKLKDMIEFGVDEKEKLIVRNIPKKDEPGGGLTFNFGSRGATNKLYNLGISKRENTGGVKTKGGTKEGPGEEFLYTVTPDYSKKPELSNLDWGVNESGTVGINGRLMAIEQLDTGQWVARIKSNEDYREPRTGGEINPVTGEPYKVKKGQVMIVPYEHIRNDYLNKFQAGDPWDMAKGWENWKLTGELNEGSEFKTVDEEGEEIDLNEF